MNSEPVAKGLLERLDEGPVICAEGYLFEFERRGYLQAGAYVPEIVLEHPDLVAGLHREFVHAGSDVVEAFTYYAHREKMRLIGKEDLIEPLNRGALAIAASVARETRLPGSRRPLQYECVLPRRRHPTRGPRDVRRADRLDRRRRDGLRDCRDVLLGRRGADRARGDQGVRAPVGRHACDPSRAGDARGLVPGGCVRTARRCRCRRRRAQLHSRAADDAAADRARA